MLTVSPTTFSMRISRAGHTAAISCISFGTEKDYYATISEDGCVMLWRLANYSLVTRIVGPCAGTCVFLFGGTMITGWADGWIRAYSCKDGKEVWKIVNAHQGSVLCVWVMERCVLSGGDDGIIRIWSAVTKSLVTQLKAHKGGVTHVRPDVYDQTVIHSCGKDRIVQTFSLQNEQRLGGHIIQNGVFTCMAQRLDGENELITTTSFGELLVWDQDEVGAVAKTTTETKAALLTCALSPDGRFLAASGDDAIVRVLDVKTLQTLARMVGHSDAVRCLAWTPDQKQLVSVGADCAICIWNFYS